MLMGKVEAHNPEPIRDRSGEKPTPQQSFVEGGESPPNLTQEFFMSEQNAEIRYSDCADALLKLWIENIITDGEYNRIMDRLNKAHKEGVI